MADFFRRIDGDHRRGDIQQRFEDLRSVARLEDKGCSGQRKGRSCDPDMTCMFYRRQRENGFNTHDPMENRRNPGKTCTDVEPIGRCPRKASSIAPSFLS